MTIKTDTTERIARIEIARPDKKNALTADMYAALADAFEAAAADRAVRAIQIQGGAECFCSGNDLKDFLERPPHGADSPVWRFLRAISGAEKPIVAAVAGPAVGIGTTMLLHCDLVFAAPETRFQMPFVPLGLVPEAGSSLLLPRVAGYQRAAQLLLLGQPFGVDKALAAGFVSEVIAKEKLLETARAAAVALCGLPAASLRETKRLMKIAQAPAVAERMQLEGDLFRERLASPEAKEAMTAFFEKRKPDFSRFD